MRRYADTSFLLSLAAQDNNSAAARAEMRRVGGSLNLPLSAFGEFEARNALRGAVKRGHLTPGDVRAAGLVLRWMMSRGHVTRRTLPWEPWLAEANRLSAALSATFGGRGLDVLHVAAARMLGAVEFLSFDGGQRTFAAAAGMTVRP